MKEVQLETGKIRYTEFGSGQPILLLHGTLSNGNTWRKVIPLLSHQFRCIVPDLPLGGHSIPMSPEADLSPEGIASIIKQFIDALNIEECIVVGNDTGGAYAQVFAAKNPSRLAALVLCNTDAFEIFPPKAFSLLQSGVTLPGFTWIMAQAFRYKPLLKSNQVFGLLSHRATKEELYELYVKSFIQQRGIREDFVKVVQGWSPEHTLAAAEKLSHFQKPALVVWGADDKMLFPLQLAHRVTAMLPNASLKVIEQSLTYVQEDQPDIFARVLISFIDSTQSFIPSINAAAND